MKDLKRKMKSGVDEKKEILKKRQNAAEKARCPTVARVKETQSNPPGLTIRVNSSPHRGRRGAPGTLYHYRRGWGTPTDGRGPVRVTCHDQTIGLPEEDKRATAHYKSTRRGSPHSNDRCAATSVLLVHPQDSGRILRPPCQL